MVVAGRNGALRWKRRTRKPSQRGGDSLRFLVQMGRSYDRKRNRLRRSTARTFRLSEMFGRTELEEATCHWSKTRLNFPSVHLRHRSAPLLNERDEYLKHLLNIGFKPSRVRCTASYVIHVVHFQEMSRVREVGPGKVEEQANARLPTKVLREEGLGRCENNLAELCSACESMVEFSQMIGSSCTIVVRLRTSVR